MSASFLRPRPPLFAGAALLLLTSAFAASCGQQGIVAATSGTTETDTGGSGGTGGTGGTATTGGTGGADTSKPLKVLCWNLHNFFNTTKDSGFTEEQVLTKTEYDNKLAAVGAVLKQMDPDFAVLPEVENLAILDDLNAKQLAGAYTTAITETNDFRGLDIGILSKPAIDTLTSHKDDSFKRLDLAGSPSYKYSRDAVEVHITHNGREVVLIGVHYRSKGNGMVETDDKDKRAAEAQHTRAIADALIAEDPKRAVLILGDFNDIPGSPAVSWTILGNPANNPQDPFITASDSVPQADRYTFVYNGVQELIDHQIANPLLGGMLDTKAAVILHGKSVEDASDHHPLMATYHIQ
ncbi:MAG: endonuclease/exonuclease/phosphatase family protein [Polyangiaceae bacterium]